LNNATTFLTCWACNAISQLGLGRLFTVVYKRRLMPSLNSTIEHHRGYTCNIA
jgi:hypothetical protein